jgi:four helix bundle protein
MEQEAGLSLKNSNCISNQTMRKSLIQEKAYNFALTIIELYRLLVQKNEYVMSKQLLKSGTSIGANVEEALAGQSRPDFLSKMSIASKEARESNYWLRLLRDSNIVEKKYLLKPLADSDEIISMLTSIVKTTSKTATSKN